VYELQAVFTDFCVNRKWRNVDFSVRGRRRPIMTADSEWQPTTSYQCLIYTFAPSRTVYELQAVFTDICVNRKGRNVDFSARGRRRSIMTIDSEWQPTTSYQCLIDTFALSRTVCELCAIFTYLSKPEMTSCRFLR